MKSNNKTQRSNRIEITDIIIFFIVFIIFGMALLSFFPGLLTSDNVDQINQAITNNYANAHPVLHSFIIGNLTKLSGIWVPALFQILIFAIGWTYCCKVARKYNDSGSNKVFQIIATLTISVIPLNFLYSITLWKDILYSYSFLILLAQIYIGVKENYKYTIPQMILIAISTISIMKLRHNGVPIGLLMFAILLVLNFIFNKKWKQSVCMLITFIVTFIVFSIPSWTINIVKTEGSDVGGVLDSTKIYCMGALLNSDIEFEVEDLEFLNSIFDINEWKNLYSPYDGTSILFNTNLNKEVIETEEGAERFNEIFIKYAKQKPGTIIVHFIKVNSIWWSIKEHGAMHSIIINNGSVSEMSNGIYDNHPIWWKGNDKLGNYAINTLSTKVVYNIMYRPAVAIWVSLITIIAICIKEKKKGYLFILLPMILNIGTYVFLMSSQDQRYFYPCFMTEYISIIIFASTFIKNEKMRNVKINKNINKENPKTLIIIPAYNESESIEKTVNSVYDEQIENCDVIVINDGSKDNTLEVAKRTNARVIDLPNNLGIGGAVQTGYLYALENDYDIAIQIDGDGQHNTKYIRNVIDQIKEGNDLVIGSRFVEKTNYNQTFMRMLGNNIISFTIKLLTGRKICDTTSGYRGANKNIIEEFAKSYPYDYPEPCTNMRILKEGYKVKEIPVMMKNRETGVSSISPSKAAIYMIKVTLAILLMGLKY